MKSQFTPEEITRLKHDINVVIGNKIRQERILSGITQARMGRLLGISLQQFRNYESGDTKITAGTLYAIARILRVPVVDFFVESKEIIGCINRRETMIAMHNFNQLSQEQKKSMNGFMRKMIKSK